MAHPKQSEYHKKYRLKNRKEGPGGDGIEEPSLEIMEYIRETYQYDPDSGSVSYKKPCTRSGPGRPRAKVGEPLGRKSPSGYIDITIQCYVRGLKRSTRAHHIGWFLYHGTWPTAGMHVHHHNSIRDDNRIINLGLVKPVEHGRHHAIEWWNTY